MVYSIINQSLNHTEETRDRTNLLDMGQIKRNILSFYHWSSFGTPCNPVFSSKTILPNAVQFITWLVVLSLCYCNVSAIPDADPRVERAAPSNLTLKVNAVQTEMNRLIEALSSPSSPPVLNSFASPERENAPGDDGFTRPPPGTTVTNLENEMKKMKEDIDKLLQSANITAEDKERLSGLEDTVKKLQKLIDDQRLELEQKIENLQSLVEVLLATIDTLRIELDDVKRKALLEEEDEKLRRLPSECIEAIKSHDFTTAVSKLQEIEKDSTINMIVNRVYDHHVSNFDLILQFAEVVNVKQRSFLVYKALGYEMEINEHRDPIKMIELIKRLRNVIINNQNTSAQTKRDAQSFENSLQNSIKIVSKEKLKHALLNDVYETNDIKILSNSVYGISDKLFGSLITEVVNEIYGRMDTKKLLKYLSIHSYIQQSIPGYAAVFNKIRNSNNDTLFNIAYCIKNAMTASTYASLDSENKSTLDQIRNSLPKSVRNAAFATKVCIENKKYPKNLFASGKYFHDRLRRMVFTWMPHDKREDRVNEDKWNLIRTGESFYFFNVAHQEYMYAPSEYDEYKEGNERRKVFTWAADESFESCKWNMEPIGDDVYIKNVVRSEYLYTSNTNKHENVNQKVFTWIPGVPVDNGVWTIVDCSDA
ncbi:uncharacterized protein LOC134288333 [Aedes albopictus]|uniref:Secreted protein n=1 Tax=Aedes albopictus TaxID=7160 RepID=A0ABM1ZTG5_AEDAL